MLDTVIVILVPGGPEAGDIVTLGLPSVPRSVVAHAVPYNDVIIPNPIASKSMFFNYDKN
jgi:hypothetical protein